MYRASCILHWEVNQVLLKILLKGTNRFCKLAAAGFVDHFLIFFRKKSH